jgi:hypothetical protein
MSACTEHRSLSETEYLDAEALADVKSEYLAGEVFAMAGASERHNRIAGNIFFICAQSAVVAHAVPSWRT